MLINGYYINGHCWLLMAILLMVIGAYWWLLMVIGGYFINGYGWLLVVILLMGMGGYWWLFY